MKTRLLVLVSVLLLLGPGFPTGAHGQLGDLLKGLQKTLGGGGLSEEEISRGLKEALQVGTGRAVEVLSRADGYYRNPAVKIPLPSAVQKMEKVLRTAGYGKEVEEFELSMNRAAERAAPEAKAVFWDSIQAMSIQDARKILKGRENEATLYFQDKTSGRLREIFKPLVHAAMGEVGATRSYQALDEKVRAVPFADRLSFDLDQYVTDKALGGLFFMLGEEEKKIRRDPAARATDLLKKVFGSP